MEDWAMTARRQNNKEDRRIRATCENGESDVDHDGGETGRALVQHTDTKYSPPPTNRECGLRVLARKIE